MLKFIHAADIHLDSPLLRLEHYEGAPVESLRQATRRAFENLVRLAIDEQADFLLISGDLYDGDWKDYNTGLYLVSQMVKLRDAGIPVCIIAGNHDAASRMTKSLRLPDGVHFFPPEQPTTFCLDDLGVAIHGQSFPRQAVTKELFAGYPPTVSGYFNIGMLHTCATGREGHEPYAPCTVGGLQSKGYDYWALGHVHQQEVLSEDPPIVFPGNIQGRHIRETGPKGCMRVRVEENGAVTTDFQPLDVIRWTKLQVDASQTDDGYGVIDSIYGQLESLPGENHGLPLIARVEVTGASSAHAELAADPERWISEVRSAATDAGNGQVWIEKVRLCTEFPAPPSSGGPVDEVIRIFDAVRKDPDRLESLGDALSPLWKKLPRELKEGPDAVRPDDADWLAEMLDQAQPMLLRRLLSRGKGR
ncbi:MAG: hypothetical protein B6245_24375 [Desulfobacteraceae bacterium 4572_88]|nr:MAG: hypothetical protein B6245_24375 [Desulfobacteraceae bacterium 4572_88]